MLRSRSAGLILQVLLAGGTYRHSLGVAMIGAMPAVAVRHERRKQEKRSNRPSQLYLGGTGIKQSSPPSRGSSPTPSPLQSPPSHQDDQQQEFYVCGKVSVLHLVVVSLLLGAILLIVGLVQLKPGADASDHRYYLIATGTFLMLMGFILTGLRCCFLPWYLKKRRRILILQRMRKDESQASGLTSGGAGAEAVLQPSLENEKNAQMELENGSGPADVGAKPDVEEGLVSPNTNGSSLSGTSEPPSVGGGLHSVIMTSPTEHDALIVRNSSSSNLEQV